jgi:hypothetical protein
MEKIVILDWSSRYKYGEVIAMKTEITPLVKPFLQFWLLKALVVTEFKAIISFIWLNQTYSMNKVHFHLSFINNFNCSIVTIIISIKILEVDQYSIVNTISTPYN